MVRKLVLGIAVATFAFSTTACNTVKGFGKDVESVGQAGEDAID